MTSETFTGYKPSKKDYGANGEMALSLLPYLRLCRELFRHDQIFRSAGSSGLIPAHVIDAGIMKYFDVEQNVVVGRKALIAGKQVKTRSELNQFNDPSKIDTSTPDPTYMRDKVFDLIIKQDLFTKGNRSALIEVRDFLKGEETSVDKKDATLFIVAWVCGVLNGHPTKKVKIPGDSEVFDLIFSRRDCTNFLLRVAEGLRESTSIENVKKAIHILINTANEYNKKGKYSIALSLLHHAAVLMAPDIAFMDKELAIVGTQNDEVVNKDLEEKRISREFFEGITKSRTARVSDTDRDKGMIIFDTLAEELDAYNAYVLLDRSKSGTKYDYFDDGLLTDYKNAIKNIVIHQKDVDLIGQALFESTSLILAISPKNLPDRESDERRIKAISGTKILVDSFKSTAKLLISRAMDVEGSGEVTAIADKDKIDLGFDVYRAFSRVKNILTPEERAEFVSVGSDLWFKSRKKSISLAILDLLRDSAVFKDVGGDKAMEMIEKLIGYHLQKIQNDETSKEELNAAFGDIGKIMLGFKLIPKEFSESHPNRDKLVASYKRLFVKLSEVLFTMIDSKMIPEYTSDKNPALNRIGSIYNQILLDDNLREVLGDEVNKIQRKKEEVIRKVVKKKGEMVPKVKDSAV